MRSSHDSTISFETSTRIRWFFLSTDQMKGNLPSRSSSDICRKSPSNTMSSFQVSAGAFLNCLAKRPSVRAKSANVIGKTIDCRLPASSL